MVEKKIKGRKRHIVTDTQGNLLFVRVHAANIHDTIAGVTILDKTFEEYPSLLGVSADEGYRGTTEKHVINDLHKTINISKKIDSGWSILPKRWVVERTFAWFNGFRRLAKDYEIRIKYAENFVRIAHISILIARLTHP